MSRLFERRLLFARGPGSDASSGADVSAAVGLPDPNGLEALTFAQPTVVYDRTGKVEPLPLPERNYQSVVISPDYSEASKFADLWISVKQGTDAALALGVAAIACGQDL